MHERAEALENLATVHLHAAGLDLGAETPAEIALAILAEILAVRRKGSGDGGYDGRRIGFNTDCIFFRMGLLALFRQSSNYCRPTASVTRAAVN